MSAQSTTAQPNFMILYVNSPKASGEFYTALLGRGPVEASPTFVMFALETGLMLGLWSRHGVEPAPSAAGGGSEIGIIGVAHTHCAGTKARGHGALLVGEKHTMTRVGRAVLDCAQSGRTIKPPVDFHARIAANQAFRRAPVPAAVRAQQPVGSCRQAARLPPSSKNFCTASNSAKRCFPSSRCGCPVAARPGASRAC
jgi:catechol 2,3-dioxygenase-like lactoylglutathione lyase family enzyme